MTTTTPAPEMVPTPDVLTLSDDAVRHWKAAVSVAQMRGLNAVFASATEDRELEALQEQHLAAALACVGARPDDTDDHLIHECRNRLWEVEYRAEEWAGELYDEQQAQLAQR